MLTRDFKLAALIGKLTEKPGVLDSQHRLGGEGVERGDDVRRKGTPVPP